MKTSFLILVCLLLTGCFMESNEVSTLEGSWLLTEIDAEKTLLSPEEEEIMITFNSGELSGNTDRNVFEGAYIVPKANHLKILKFASTEVAETEWGNFFFEVFNQAYVPESGQWFFTYSVTTDKLILKSGEAQSDILKFMRK